MSDLEAFRLSAQACGYKETVPPLANEYGVAIQAAHLFVWNPFTDAEQRWECVRKLLNTGDIRFSEHGVHEFHPQYGGITRIIDCPAEEFPARALAELESRKEKS